MGWGAAAAAAASAVGGIASSAISSSASKDAANTQANASRDATAATLKAAQDAIAKMEGYTGQALGVLSPFFGGKGGSAPISLASLPGITTGGTGTAANANGVGGSAAGAPTADQLKAIQAARPDLYSAFQKDGSTSDFGQWLQNWYSQVAPGGANHDITNDASIASYGQSTNSPNFGGFVNFLSGQSGANGAGAYADPTAAITSAYQTYLGRPPTEAEMEKSKADYTTGYASGNPLSKVQSGITSSPEYQADLAAGKISSDGGFNKAPGMAGMLDLASGSSSSPVISSLQSLANLSAGAYDPLKSIVSGTDPNMKNLAAITSGTSPALAAEQSVFAGNAPTLRSLSDLANGTSNLTAGLMPAQVAGSKATAQLSDYLTNPGSYQTSPGYKFELDQGLNAINNAALATGAGGNTQQAAAKYAEGLASQDYFNTLTSLQSLANLGTSAASTSAGIGAGAATSLGGIGQSAAANLTGAQTDAAKAGANIGAAAAGQLTSTAAGAQGDMASIIANALSQLYGGSLSSSQSAAALLSNLGSAVGSTTVGAGNNVSSNVIGAGNANAAGQIGSANAVAGGINNATSGIGNALLMYQLLGKAA